MSKFFNNSEKDFQGRIYREYFNLYPDLWLGPTLDHLEKMEQLEVVDVGMQQESWRIEARFYGYDFLLETDCQKTSTLFSVAKEMQDERAMLAFLGCFLPVIRDYWPIPKSARTPPKMNWFMRLNTFFVER